MTELERSAATCLFPAFPGTVAPEWILRWVGRGLGGVVLFGGNVESREQVAALTAQLRSARGDLLVATDEEGGDVTRLEAARGSSYPGAWALGVVDEPELTEAVAAAIAAELASVGINFNLAPVADVNSNPNNPVIGIRAFGSDSELVARHVFAFVAGLQRSCVAACAKHFPGHGDTAEDSHLELPVARELALEPFRAAIGAGVRSIMTAHVVAPALDAAPATLSRRLVQELLREELAYGGAVISDALEMKAVSAAVGVEEAAVLALDAGVDALCLGADVDEMLVRRVHTAVVAAVRSGRITEARLDEAAARVRDLARWAMHAEGGSPADAVGLDAARRALRVDGDVVVENDPVVVELRPPPLIAAGAAAYGLADVLDGANTIALTDAPPDVTALLEGRQPVVVVRDAHRHAWQRETVERLLVAAPDAVVVEVGVPLWQPRTNGYIATHGASRASFVAAAERLRPQNVAV